MRKRDGIQTTGIVFGILSIAIILSSQTVFFTTLSSFLTTVTVPASQGVIALTSYMPFSPKTNEKRLETALLQVSAAEDEKETKALRDQFDEEEISPQKLLPVRIIGYQGYLPGVREPSSLIISAGLKQGVLPGQAVVYENNLVGRISKSTDSLSKVQLLSDQGITFTAETLSNKSNGVIKGGQDTMIFGNVILSEVLEKGDLVVTKGDVTIDGNGFPPNIIVGEITVTEKRQSDLFQLARVESLLRITDLTTVFVYKAN